MTTHHTADQEQGVVGGDKRGAGTGPVKLGRFLPIGNPQFVLCAACRQRAQECKYYEFIHEDSSS